MNNQTFSEIIQKAKAKISNYTPPLDKNGCYKPPVNLSGNAKPKEINIFHGFGFVAGGMSITLTQVKFLYNKGKIQLFDNSAGHLVKVAGIPKWGDVNVLGHSQLYRQNTWTDKERAKYTYHAGIIEICLKNNIGRIEFHGVDENKINMANNSDIDIAYNLKQIEESIKAGFEQLEKDIEINKRTKKILEEEMLKTTNNQLAVARTLDIMYPYQVLSYGPILNTSAYYPSCSPIISNSSYYPSYSPILNTSSSYSSYSPILASMGYYNK